jgi:uncharacterized protein YndB with AHSA1/START domain
MSTSNDKAASAPSGAEAADFVISRTFNAPRALVWQAWTQADRLAQWWGPKGSKIRVARLDTRPGRLFHYSMEYQPGHPMWGRFVFHEVVAPERMIYTSSFSDANGSITRAPFKGIVFPLEVLNIVTFTEQGSGQAAKTAVTLRGGPVNTTEEERATFTGMFDSMRQGFGGTFDQLEAYLANAR